MRVTGFSRYSVVVLNSVTVTAPAKLNLALRVGSPRPDGFHPLNTVFYALSIRDTITVEAAETISLVCDHPGVPLDESNLAHRAARAIGEHTGTKAGARITIDKRIPIAGGMAGGSADGAAVLVALNELWQTGLDANELHNLAAGLGSDVPFALLGGCAVGTSRGENLNPIDACPLTWVLVTSSEGLSTPAVFGAYDAMVPHAHDPAPVDEIVEALGQDDTERVGALLANDLAAPAFALRPDIRATFEKVKDRAGAAILSGSGPTIALLAASEDDGRRLQRELNDDGYVSLVASGPARGVTVVEERS